MISEAVLLVIKHKNGNKLYLVEHKIARKVIRAQFVCAVPLTWGAGALMPRLINYISSC
jgi:hypothetical protein